MSSAPTDAGQGSEPTSSASTWAPPAKDSTGATKALWLLCAALLAVGLLLGLAVAQKKTPPGASSVSLGAATSALLGAAALVGGSRWLGSSLRAWQVALSAAMATRALWMGLGYFAAGTRLSPAADALAVASSALELCAALLFATRHSGKAPSEHQAKNPPARTARRALALWDGLALGLGAGALLWWLWRVPLMLRSLPAGKPAVGVGLPGLLAFSLSAGAALLLVGHALQVLAARERGRSISVLAAAANALALMGALGLCVAQARWLNAGVRGGLGPVDAMLACLSPLALASGLMLAQAHGSLHPESERAPWESEQEGAALNLGAWALGLACAVGLAVAWRLGAAPTRAAALGAMPGALWWAPVLVASAAARLAWPRSGAAAGSRESRREVAELRGVVARRTHQLATLHSMTADLSDTLSCERILTTAVERVLLALDARCAAVWLNIDASELSLDDRPQEGAGEGAAGMVRTVPVALFVWREMERTGTERRALDRLHLDGDAEGAPGRQTQKIGGSGGALGGVAVADKNWSMALARGHEQESARRVLSQMHRLLEFGGLERFARLAQGDASALDIHPRDVGLRAITVQSAGIKAGASSPAQHAPRLLPRAAQKDDSESDSLLREMHQVLEHAHMAPIRSKGDMLGALGAWRPGIELDEAERSLVAALALEVGAVMQNVQLYQETSRLADRDSLTDLLNHRAIQSQLNAILARTHRADGTFAVIMMDLNNFKYFNDTYGHPEGDRVLRTVARCLREACRGGDIIGRFGGDEFIALLLDTDAEGAQQACERIADRIKEEGYQQRGDARRIPITLSFGAALYPQDGSSALELLTFADSQLYESKRGGSAITIRKQSSDEAELSKLKQAGTGGSFGVLDALVTAIDNKDHYTRRHSEDVAHWASMMARQLAFSSETQRAVRIAGLLHDVGKIAVPDSILRKPGRLGDDEFQIMQQHPVFGALIVKDVPNLPEVLGGIRHHHERFDGKGYPDKLRGEDIPLLGRLLAVPDCFSAMTTDRPYRKALTGKEAMDEIEKGKGTQFDPVMADAFLTAMKRVMAGEPDEPEPEEPVEEGAAEAVARSMADPDAKSTVPAMDGPQYLPRSVADAEQPAR